MYIKLDNLLKGFTARIFIIIAISSIAYMLLIISLWDKQLRKGEKFTSSVAKQSIRRIRTSPVRGRIFSSDLKILADTKPIYSIVFHLSEMRQPGRFSRKKTIAYSLKEIHNIAKLIGRTCILTKIDIKKHIRYKPAMPLDVFKQLTSKELALASEIMPKPLGMQIVVRYDRVYPFASFGTHFLGFTGRRRPDQSEEPKGSRAFYVKDELTGRAGLEKVFDKDLSGKAGIRLIRTDIAGYLYEELPGAIAAVGGNELILNIDSIAQKTAEVALKDKIGAVVILDCNTGAVLAMASSPSYDLSSLSAKRYSILAQDTLRTPLLNRALSSWYTPGSIIKPLIALAALQNNIITLDTIINCHGYYKIGERKIHCWKRDGHGDVNVIAALEESCNSFFIDVAIQTKLKNIQPVLESAGIGRKTGIELESDGAGIFPTREFKRKHKQASWNITDTGYLGIGQGIIGVSPLQVALYTAGIANGGKIYTPYLVKKILSPAGKTLFIPPVTLRSVISVNKEYFKIVKEGMSFVVFGENPTAPIARDCVIPLSGKTGTAEVGYGKNRYKNTWFTCFGPIGSPKYVMTVMIEHGKSGGKTAAPIAVKIFNQWLGKN